MIHKDHIAGAVVLYNSSYEVLHNIDTYIDQISKLYIVDNSTKPNHDLVKKLNKLGNIMYMSLNGNKGIATALNSAANQAIIDGYSILLTMDDDTQTPLGMINQMITFWNNYQHPIGILSGVHHTKTDETTYRLLPYTLTSGNLLNLSAYKEIGPFINDLFIDHVDHEYGLRLNDTGYHVIELPSIRLIHQLGYTKNIRIGSFSIRTYGSHPPIRLYYFARNGVYLAKRYYMSQPIFVWRLTKELMKRYIKALFLQDKRIERLNMLSKGIKDGWRNKLGKYNGKNFG